MARACSRARSSSLSVDSGEGTEVVTELLLMGLEWEGELTIFKGKFRDWIALVFENALTRRATLKLEEGLLKCWEEWAVNAMHPFWEGASVKAIAVKNRVFMIYMFNEKRNVFDNERA